MRRSRGFDAAALSNARILVLGSLPGRRSIEQQQYYAHPRNAFWPIMEALYGIRGDYAERLGQLAYHQIALWDVLESSVRPGSLDSRIAMPSASANDFARLFHACPDIRLIAFNGQKAAQLFRRLVPAEPCQDRIEQVQLPSTSPAYAAMPFSVKLARWREVLGPANGP